MLELQVLVLVLLFGWCMIFDKFFICDVGIVKKVFMYRVSNIVKELYIDFFYLIRTLILFLKEVILLWI